MSHEVTQEIFDVEAQFANVFWTAADVIKEAAGSQGVSLSVTEAHEFLSACEEEITSTMISVGWDLIHEQLPEFLADLKNERLA